MLEATHGDVLKGTTRTHLILGRKTVRNDTGNLQGYGSCIHSQALNAGVKIVGEESVWAMLRGEISNATELEEGGAQDETRNVHVPLLTKPATNSILNRKVLFVLRDSTEPMSLEEIDAKLHDPRSPKDH